jgi:tetratricopeptide (TPR) repeat protein
LALDIFANQTDVDLSWTEQRVRLAPELIASASLSRITERLLETISVLDGPLPGHELAEHLGVNPEEFGQAVMEAESYSLLHESANGYLQTHPLIKDFFFRAFRRREDAQSQLNDLASRAKSYFPTTSMGTVLYVESLLSTFRLLGLASRLDEALALRSDLRGVLYQTAIELYQQRNYRQALGYFELVVGQDPFAPNTTLYIARCLAYLGQIDEARAMLSQLSGSGPTEARILRVRGRVEFIARDWDAAISYLEQALYLRPNYTPLLEDLGQATMRKGEWREARSFLQRAVNAERTSPFALTLYSQVLEHFGELGEARTWMERAVQQDSQNPAFHHRLGRIAQLLGDTSTALKEYARALELDPRNSESRVSLASLRVDLGEVPEARRLLAEVRRDEVRATVMCNLYARVSLFEDNIDEARNLVSRALSHERSLENVGLAARIEIRALELRNTDCQTAQERIERMTEELTHLGQHEEVRHLLDRLTALCS